MTEFRYKAFISYSHRDEEWGQWLQKSLESYRIPRRLVGSPGRHGEVPARVAPVFRDREDLSSAADLTSSVREELAASETLIVICSPAAAASPWVNEEIRHFKALGRGDRILALIVDGDPQAQDPDSRCFPAAVVESGDGEVHEPLAADARKWADGKSLARLKLVAGILGIRLDDLRRRDAQRKHRIWMISTSAAMSIALLTTVLAIFAITARNQAETRRQHAEDLVDYMVDDLKEKLDEVGRLDILEGVGDEVSKYLETLNPQEESEESLLQKAKVWRQLGEVGMSQGKLDDSMTAFEASREVTRELLRRQPLDVERVYEMAQAEFWVGYVHLEKGAFEVARLPLENYLLYANTLAELEPNNPEWIMEQSYAHGNIAALINLREGGDVALALDQITASVELNRRAMELSPDNQEYMSEYGEALAWQADTQMLLCNLGGALQSRQENLRIAHASMEREPANVNRRQRYAWSLSGLANVSKQVGLVDQAGEHLKKSAHVLGQLYQANSSNVDYRWDELYRRVFVAVLEAEAGQVEASQESLETLYDPLLAILQSEGEENHRRRKEWIAFLLRYAEVAWLAADIRRAEKLWAAGRDQITNWIAEGTDPQVLSGEIVFATFLKWHYDRNSEGGQLADVGLPKIWLDDSSRHISCEDRSLLVLQALMKQNKAEAGAHTEHLLSKGYFEPGFIRICRQYDLCQGQG